MATQRATTVQGQAAALCSHRTRQATCSPPPVPGKGAPLWSRGSKGLAAPESKVRQAGSHPCGPRVDGELTGVTRPVSRPLQPWTQRQHKTAERQGRMADGQGHTVPRHPQTAAWPLWASHHSLTASLLGKMLQKIRKGLLLPSLSRDSSITQAACPILYLHMHTCIHTHIHTLAQHASTTPMHISSPVVSGTLCVPNDFPVGTWYSHLEEHLVYIPVA